MTRAGAKDISGAGRSWTPPRRAAVRWRVGVAAARALFNTASSSVVIEIGLNANGNSDWRGEVRLDLGDHAPRVLREADVAVRWTHDADLGLVHIDAESFLHATIDVSGGLAELVYARTTQLGDLGLRGGRYEPVGAEIEERADRTFA